MFIRRLEPLALAIGVSLLLAGCSGSGETPSDRGASTHVVGHPGENKQAPDRSRVWTGEAPSDVAYAAEVLSALASENEDVTGGVSLTSDATMVEIYVTERGDYLRDAMQDALGEGFERLVRIVDVEYSTNDLVAAQEAIGDALWDALINKDWQRLFVEIADNVDVIVLDGSRQSHSLRVRSLGLNVVDVGVPMLVRESAQIELS